MAFIIGLVGVAVTAIGVLLMVASAMPSYGGRRDGTPEFVGGLAMFFAGIAVIFYAGTWI